MLTWFNWLKHLTFICLQVCYYIKISLCFFRHNFTKKNTLFRSSHKQLFHCPNYYRYVKGKEESLTTRSFHNQQNSKEIFTSCYSKPLLVILPSCKVFKFYFKKREADFKIDVKYACRYQPCWSLISYILHWHNKHIHQCLDWSTGGKPDILLPCNGSFKKKRQICLIGRKGHWYILSFSHTWRRSRITVQMEKRRMTFWGRRGGGVSVCIITLILCWGKTLNPIGTSLKSG